MEGFIPLFVCLSLIKEKLPSKVHAVSELFFDPYLKEQTPWLLNEGGERFGLSKLRGYETGKAFGLPFSTLREVLSFLLEAKDDPSFKLVPLDKGVAALMFFVDRKAPTAIITPGGGYAFVSLYNEGIDYALALKKHGFNSLILKYSCREGAAYPRPLEEVATCIKLMQTSGLGNGDYFLIGSSAGGHLSGLFASKAFEFGVKAPKAAILAYPVITLSNPTHVGSRRYFLGEKRNDLEERKRFGVQNNVTSSYPPTYIWGYSQDAVVPPDGRHLMVEALMQNGVPYKEKEVSGPFHGVGVGKGTLADGWFEEALAFVRPYL